MNTAGSIRPGRAVALMVSATVLVSACSALEPARDPVADAAAEARVGGTLLVGITQPGAIDPMSTTTTAGRLVADTLCDTLLVRDPRTNQLREGIADTWVQGGSGSFVTIRPIHGVKFNDGSTLQAKDIAFTMRQLAARVNDSPYAGLAKPFSGGVIGTDGEGSGPRPGSENLLVESAQQGNDLAQPLNDYDVQAQSQVSNGNTSAVFAEGPLAPISQRAFERDAAAFRANPVCVGPYRLERPYEPGDKVITLVRSDHYFDENLGYTRGGAGYADRIEFHIFPSSTAVDEAYAEGKIDIAQVIPRPGNLAPGQDPEPQLTPEIKPALAPEDVVRGKAAGVEYVGFPRMLDGELNSAVVRRAISMALDRTQLAAALGPFATPATGLLPPSLEVDAGRRGRIEAPGITVPGCAAAEVPARPDVAGARALLAEAGIDLKGKELVLTAPVLKDDATLQSFGILMQRQLQDAFGVSVVRHDTEWNYYALQMQEGGDGFAAPFLTGWASRTLAPVPTWNDPGLFMQSMFGSKSRGAGNVAPWSSAEFDGLLSGLLETEDQGEQSHRVGLLNDLLCEELPYVPTVFTTPLWRVRADTLGSALGNGPVGTDGQLLLREVFVRP